VLDYIKKDVRCEETERAFEAARKNGLRALATVMVGLPVEDPSDLEKTVGLIDRIKPDFVAPFFATPYPGTELYDIARGNGLIDATREIKWQSTEEPVMTVKMPASEIKRVFEKLLNYNNSAFADYLFQPRFILDLLMMLVKNPKCMFKMAACGISGKRREMMNVFLYMFRKEMVGY